jgi:hypothetical protein
VVQTYVELAAQLGVRDPLSVSGDTAISTPRDDVGRPTFESIAERARSAKAVLDAIQVANADDERRTWVGAQLEGVAARASWLAGHSMSLDVELHGQFGIGRPPALSPSLPLARSEIDRLLPGPEPLSSRLDDFDKQSIVSPDRLPAVFSRALDECRRRTLTRLSLPGDEHAAVRYVSGQPWSGFSRYLGQHQSEIDVNTSFPLTVDRVLDLACHEGYPGHHVLNVMRDDLAAHGRPELEALPLFTPDAFATETAAVTASSLVFDEDARLAFERDVLFPAAGLPPERAARHVTVNRLLARLSPAIGAALFDYLSGAHDYVETAWALQTDALMAHPEATIQFTNQYRGFALAYTWIPSGALAVGGQLVRCGRCRSFFEAFPPASE